MEKDKIQDKKELIQYISTPDYYENGGIKNAFGENYYKMYKYQTKGMILISFILIFMTLFVYPIIISRFPNEYRVNIPYFISIIPILMYVPYTKNILVDKIDFSGLKLAARTIFNMLKGVFIALSILIVILYILIKTIGIDNTEKFVVKPLIFTESLQEEYQNRGSSGNKEENTWIDGDFNRYEKKRSETVAEQLEKMFVFNNYTDNKFINAIYNIIYISIGIIAIMFETFFMLLIYLTFNHFIYQKYGEISDEWRKKSIYFTAGIFSLMHFWNFYSIGTVFIIFPAGYYLTKMFTKTKNMILVGITHFMYDAVIINLIVLANKLT